MGVEVKQVRDRFDVAVHQVETLAKAGWSLKPMTVKLSGNILFATMERHASEGSEISETEQVPAVLEQENSPVTAKVVTAKRQPKKG